MSLIFLWLFLGC